MATGLAKSYEVLLSEQLIQARSALSEDPEESRAHLDLLNLHQSQVQVLTQTIQRLEDRIAKLESAGVGSARPAVG
jgi:hypothetical protein